MTLMEPIYLHFGPKIIKKHIFDEQNEKSKKMAEKKSATTGTSSEYVKPHPTLRGG